jgi:transcriptional regulator with XRE-family HTH domain
MKDETRQAALRAFLRECRARLAPEQVGIKSIGRRRVAGLRREEVAQLVGVGVGWYTLFETDPKVRVSPRMLQSLANAFQLSREETVYLFSLAIDEMPALPRTSISEAGSVGNEYAEMTLFAKRARAASTLGELRQLATDLLLHLSRPTDIAYFVEADLEARQFVFTSQSAAPGVELAPPDPVPFSAVPDSETVLLRGEIYGEHNLEGSTNEIMRLRAQIAGTGRFLSAGIKAPGLDGAIGYSQPSREPHTDRERYLLGLIAEFVVLALASRH